MTETLTAERQATSFEIGALYRLEATDATYQLTETNHSKERGKFVNAMTKDYEWWTLADAANFLVPEEDAIRKEAQRDFDRAAAQARQTKPLRSEQAAAEARRMIDSGENCLEVEVRFGEPEFFIRRKPEEPVEVPSVECHRIAGMWGAFLGQDVSVRQVRWMLTLVEAAKAGGAK